MTTFLATTIFIFSLFAVDYSHGYSTGRNIVINQRISEECGFKCIYSGECVSKEQECDGSIDCIDATDESSSCSILRCPHYTFRCAYGACINADLVCDGKPDCADKSDETSVKCQRTNKTKLCGINEFQCNSGQCIDLTWICDGSPHCADESDESFQTCSHLRCPKYSFRCSYGACISGDAKCDGVKDCLDGSDETSSLCQYIIFPNSTSTNIPWIAPKDSCVLPPHPEGGKWIISKDLSESYVRLKSFARIPGQRVEPGTKLLVSCNNNFVLNGNEMIECENGNWNSPLGTCAAPCAVPQYNATVGVICNLNSKEIDCSEAVNDTIIQVNCSSTAEEVNMQRKCVDGRWEPPLPKCEIPKFNIIINLNVQQHYVTSEGKHN